MPLAQKEYKDPVTAGSTRWEPLETGWGMEILYPHYPPHQHFPDNSS